MSLPLGFEEKLGSNRDYRLKPLYGLRLQEHGLKSQVDHSMFYEHSKEGNIANLIVYVDDMILTRDDIEELKRLKKRLANDSRSRAWVH